MSEKKMMKELTLEEAARIYPKLPATLKKQLGEPLPDDLRVRVDGGVVSVSCSYRLSDITSESLDDLPFPPKCNE